MLLELAALVLALGFRVLGFGRGPELPATSDCVGLRVWGFKGLIGG